MITEETVLTGPERELLGHLRGNLTRIMRAQDLSEREVAALAGLKDLSGVLRGDALPSMAVPVRLAEALGVPVGELLRDPEEHLRPSFGVLPVDKVNERAARLLPSVLSATQRALDRSGERPSLDMIISWWKETRGDLSSGDQIAPHFDLVSAAEALSALPRVHQVGPQSLTARTLGSAETGRLERFLESLSATDLQELNRHIRSVSHSGIGVITPVRRVVTRPGTGETIPVSFVRLMLPVRDRKGRRFVLNYATLLSETPDTDPSAGPS